MILNSHNSGPKMTDSFTWALPGLDGPRFRAMTNLLSLRNGGQLDTPEFDEADDSDASDGSETSISEADTTHPVNLHSSGHMPLKKKFLDRLAEVISKQHKWRHVACTVLKESEDQVDVYVTKNDGLDKDDQAFFRTLEKGFLDLGSRDAIKQKAVEGGLRSYLVQYHEARLDVYISGLNDGLIALRSASRQRHAFPHVLSEDLRANVQDSEDIGVHDESTAPLYMASTGTKIEELESAASELSQTTSAHTELRSILVQKAYDLRRRKSTRLLIQNTLDPKSANQLIWNIQFLGRLEAALRTFTKCVAIFPHFQTLSIYPKRKIACPEKMVQQDQVLSLTETLKSVNLSLSPSDIKTFVNNTKGVSEAQKKFDALQKSALPTHAEVQMILYLLKNRMSFGDVVPYIGCSKKSCFMCHAFLQSCSDFGTRGCHEQLFPLWTVAKTAGLEPSSVEILVKSLKKMRNMITRKLLEPIGLPRQHGRLSSAGVTATTDGQSSLFADHEAYRGSIRMREQHSRGQEHSWLVSSLESLKTSEETTLAQIPSDPGSPIEDKVHYPDDLEDECFVCSKPTKRKCSACGTLPLCGNRCEDVVDYPRHTFRCSKRPIDTADHLKFACIEDELPTDPDTMRDFGFSAFSSFDQRSKLFGLYIGLLHEKHLAVSSRALHKWQVDGVLAEEIVAKYETLPQGSRGGYYPWFLKNRHCVEKVADAVTKTEESEFARIQPYLDVADRGKNPGSFAPKAKQGAALFYKILLDGWHPPPRSVLWYDLGFCTCTRIGAEGKLGPAYLMLINKCTFLEFWSAFENCQLASLFQAKSLGATLREFKNLDVFLSTPRAGPHPSVWELNKFLCLDDAEPIRSVLVDYGFFYCKTAKDRLDLKDIYRHVLETTDPMDLHRACLRGELYDFAKLAINVDPRFRAIMKNPYPLTPE